MKPRAIILDWDDTVVATFNGVLDLHQKFAANRGEVIDLELRLKKAWGKPLKEIFAELHPNDKWEIIEREYFDFVEQVDYTGQPFGYALEALKKLKSQGLLLGVVTSSPRKGLDRTLTRYIPDSSELFEFIYSGDECLHHKPDARVFDLAFRDLERLGIKAGEVYFVGDGMSDYLAAKARRIKFIGLLSGFTTQEQFQEAGLKESQILPSLEQLPAFLA